MLPRTVFGAYKNATARRNHSMEKKQKESAERLFVRIEKAVNHPDSCFLNKKQRKQLTSMCLQLLHAAAAAARARSSINSGRCMAAGEQVQVAELKTILKTAGLDSEGLKVTSAPTCPEKQSDAPLGELSCSRIFVEEA